MPRALIALLTLAVCMMMSTALAHAQILPDLTLGWDFE